MFTALPRTACLAFVLTWGLPSWATAEPSNFVRVTLNGPRVVFETIEYQIEQTHGAYVARITEILGHGFKERSRIALVTKEEWATWMHAITQAISTAPKDSSVSTKTRYDITVHSKNARISLRLSDPEFQSKTPAWIAIAQFLEFIRQQVGPTVYWDGRLRENERGQIRIQSLPAAGIILDGVRLGVKSPVQSLYVASGHHHVELIHPQTAQKWSYRVFVKAGATTVLKVELK